MGKVSGPGFTLTGSVVLVPALSGDFPDPFMGEPRVSH